MRWLNMLWRAGYWVEVLANGNGDGRCIVNVSKDGGEIPDFSECDWLAEELFCLACKRLGLTKKRKPA